METIKKIGAFLLLVLTTVTAILFFKNSDKELVEQNEKVKDKVNEKEEEIKNNDSELKNEEEKRKEIHEDAETKRNTEENLADFFNSRPPSNTKQ